MNASTYAPPRLSALLDLVAKATTTTGVSTRKFTQCVCEPGSCCRAAMASSTCSRDARGKGLWSLFLALMGTWASRSRQLKRTAVDQTAALQLPASSSLSTLPLLAHHSVYYHHRKPFSKYSPTKEISGLQLLQTVLPPHLEMFLIFGLLILHKPSPLSQ